MIELFKGTTGKITKDENVENKPHLKTTEVQQMYKYQN